jgi:hypothetical protein
LYLGEERVLLRSMLDHEVDDLLRRFSGHLRLLNLDLA